MKGFRKIIRNFFGTTRAQTNGFVVLLLVIAISIFSQPLMRWWVSSRPVDLSKEKMELDSLVNLWTSKEIEDQKPAEARNEITYFNFDPNTTTEAEFISLGFSKKLATRILNYRSKNGKFRIKSDLLKLYGMDSALYARIEPYIVLPDENKKSQFEDRKFAEYTNRPKEKSQFNLNEADTIQLDKIYGVGFALAKRIIKYRERLGGFIAQTQLKEIRGLDTAVVKKIISASYLPELPVVKKINLNTADEKMLAVHPYFGRRIASAIVAYRFQHGNFKSVDDLSRITLIDKNNLGRLFPYVTVDP